MKFSFPNLSTRFACSLVCSAVLCFSSVRATADMTNDVAQILAVLRSMNDDGIYTFPLADDIDYQFLSDYFGPYLDNIAYLKYGNNSYLAGLVFLHALTGSFNPSIANTLPGIIPLLVGLNSVTGHVESIDYSTASYLPYLMDLYNDFGLLADEYYNGTWSDAWNVHLSDDSLQMYDFVLSNNLDWVQREIGYYVGNELHVDLSPITDILYSILAQQDNINDAATTEGHQMSGTVDQWVETGDANDSDTQSDAEDDMRDTDEPEMDDYQTASSTSDTYDVDKDDLLDNLPDDQLSHSPILTLIDGEHFFRATGVQGDMAFNMNHGNFGSFVADMSTLCRSGWRGLLAVLSALLFWRKQNEISAIVRASNISRVD